MILLDAGAQRDFPCHGVEGRNLYKFIQKSYFVSTLDCIECCKVNPYVVEDEDSND